MAQTGILPKPGVVRGATPSVSAGRWYDANLMRFRGGQVLPMGGNAALIGAVFDSPGRDVVTWHDTTYKRWAAVGTDAKLWAYDFDLNQVYDITPTGVGPLDVPGPYDGFGLGDYSSDAYGTERDASQIGPGDISAELGDWWSLDNFGEDLLVVPTQDGRLYRWSPQTPTTPAALISTAPIQNRGVVVTEERHVVLLGSGGDPRNVAWSDQENPAVWAPTVANMAGALELVTEGRPLRGARVPGGVLIFTDNDVHLMRYLGPPYAYGINRIGFNCGLMSPRAIAVAGGVAQWMGVQSFWSYTGTVQVVSCDVQDWLFSLINRSQIGRIFAGPNPSFTELWWFYPAEDSVECNRYVAVNYGEPQAPWTIGLSDRTAADVTGAMIRPILAGADNLLYVHDYGWTDNGATRVGQVYIETGDITMEQLGGDPERRMQIRQIRYDYSGPPGAMGFRFFTFEETDGQVWDNGSMPAGDPSGLLDTGFSCRGLRMRIESLTDDPFALGVTRPVYRQGGFR